mmetsp:Transcript_18724/g.24116  ORF Transcript_18724/g.24116 Transcript_18724/m.24116 type:complete len:134 (+) Transcript_18724:1300-1701(+)
MHSSWSASLLHQMLSIYLLTAEKSFLSEYIPTTVQQIIDISKKTATLSSSLKQHEGSSPVLASSSVENKHSDGKTSRVTRETMQGRLALSLDIVRALFDLHFKYPTGPIAHADITTEQLLVTSDGRVKINDFN